LHRLLQLQLQHSRAPRTTHPFSRPRPSNGMLVNLLNSACDYW
jgi:hypothetical protein